ncbi:MAG TPA: sigma 54-interacting transcriptional regulator [Vicinamibacterales bacterium]|nr:sigma 54-interacting transcriptional regulator [Vicinamibacterales bacterium]
MTAEDSGSLARALADRLGQIASLPAGVTRIVATTAPDRATRAEVRALVERRARDLGYAPVRIGVSGASDERRLGHRHAVVLVESTDEVDEACRLARRLARLSDRAHVIIDLSREGPATSRGCGAVFARERAPAYGEAPPTRSVELRDVRFDRAVAFLNRRRSAAGERWLRAALESARRRRDEVAEARAACRLMQALTARDAWRDARRAGTEVCNRLRSWPARLAVAGELARILIAVGELTRADTLLASLDVEAALRREPIPRIVRLRRAEVRFWQGRFEEARDLLPADAAESAAERAVRGLVAWAIGEITGPPDAEVTERPRLARACLAESRLARGRVEEARVALGPPVTSEATLEDAVLERLRAACGGRPEVASPLTTDLIRREGARGLLRWGLRRTGVHLLHAVPALLQIVHDAEDEMAALHGGCAWVRSHVGADAAALVTSDQAPRLVAGEGLADRDLSDELIRDALAHAGRVVARGPSAAASAPVRSLGATIGLAVVLGRSEMAASLQEGADLLASMCAPAMRGRLDTLALAGAGRSLAPDILGESPAMAAVREAIARAAVTPFPVLIEGESGTGKELAARALHRLSARRDRRLSAVNCAALTDELVEAELFGYVRGAFTGAIGTRPGLFEEANGSTLLLDEVSELSARAQAKLLRTLQEREIRRLGENASRPVDVRVIAATNQPLADEVGRGRFREDLMFRLAVVKIRLPALRERVEDIPPLAQAFWRRVIAEVGKHAVLEADALVALSRHGWPGNVRELQNVMAGLALAAPARGRVGARHVALVLDGRSSLTPPAPSLVDARRTFERQLVSATLARNAGRRTAAARELGLTRQGLIKAMKRLGLESARDVSGVA